MTSSPTAHGVPRRHGRLFAALSAGFVLVSAYRIYLRQLLEIHWRRGVTTHYVDH